MSEMATTVTWVQDVEGRYEVSSPEHLKQIMHRGGLYTEAGTPPSYTSSSTKFIQTVDIDLLGDSTDIIPISPFYGSYDGANHSVSNWVYLDPEFETENDCISNAGLFASASLSNVRHNPIIQNIRLTGLWKLQGVRTYAGFLAGFGRSNFINIIGDFSPGSCIIEGTNSTSVTRYFGGLIGWGDKNITDITLKGTIDIVLNESNTSTSYVGGLVGRLIHSSTYYTSTVQGLQNFATFPSGLNGSHVGGVLGGCANSSVSNLVSAITGNLNSILSCGGVIGEVIDLTEDSCTTMLNAMTGDITGGSGGAGGIFGDFDGGNVDVLMNYMSGNISSSDASKDGGIIGNASSITTLGDSINAMNGSVFNSVIGTGGNGNVSSSIDASFGLTFTNDTNSILTPPVLTFDSGFPELPYVALTGTSPVGGHTYELDFVFANLAGSSTYDDYTHLILHKDDIDVPFSVNFDIPENNTVLYLTFVNALTGVVNQPNLTVLVPVFLTIETRSINIPITIDPVTGALAYRITYQTLTGRETTAFTDFTDLNKNIVNLEPETQYTIRLYTNKGNGYMLTNEIVTTTLSNSPGSYVIADFQREGLFDLTSVNNETTRAELSGVLDQLFATGDVVSVSIENNPQLDALFVKLGESLNVENVNSVLLPFDDSNGTGQNASIVLSDDVTSVSVDYDETNNVVDVGGTVYAPGDAFILDNRKVTVLDF